MTVIPMNRPEPERGTLQPKDAVILGVASIPVVLLEIWIYFTISSSGARLLLMVGVLLCAGCAFLTGNSYRNNDRKRRQVLEVRNGTRDAADLLKLPPPQTLRARLTLGIVGVLIGIVITIVAGVLAGDQVGDAVVLAVLNIVATFIAGLLATYTTPAD